MGKRRVSQDDRRRPVRFIRKNGRIIPIHISRGVGQLAGGTVVGVAGGLAAAALHNAPNTARKFGNRIMWEGARQAAQSSAYRSVKSFDPRQISFEHLGDAARKTHAFFARRASARYKTALALRKIASHGPKLAVPTFLVASGIASAYFAAAGQNLLKKVEKNDVKRSLVADVMGGAGFVVTATSFLRGTGTKPLSKAFRQTLQVLPSFLKNKGSIGMRL